MQITYSLNQIRDIVETLKNPFGLSDYSVVANLSVPKTSLCSSMSQVLKKGNSTEADSTLAKRSTATF